jgi:hypothetical protein
MLEERGNAPMAKRDCRAKGRVAGSGLRPTLSSLYEAARKEVFADPAAAVQKYQPTWLLAAPSAAQRTHRRHKAR